MEQALLKDLQTIGKNYVLWNDEGFFVKLKDGRILRGRLSTNGNVYIVLDKNENVEVEAVYHVELLYKNLELVVKVYPANTTVKTYNGKKYVFVNISEPVQTVKFNVEINHWLRNALVSEKEFRKTIARMMASVKNSDGIVFGAGDWWESRRGVRHYYAYTVKIIIDNDVEREMRINELRELLKKALELAKDIGREDVAEHIAKALEVLK